MVDRVKNASIIVNNFVLGMNDREKTGIVIIIVENPGEGLCLIVDDF